jgi:hypothetical protein
VRAPIVVALQPNTGSQGTIITISGANFTTDSKIFFGANQADTFMVDSPIQVTVKAPAPPSAPPVTVDILVKNSTSTSPADPPFTEFTYVS